MYASQAEMSGETGNDRTPFIEQALRPRTLHNTSKSRQPLQRKATSQSVKNVAVDMHKPGKVVMNIQALCFVDELPPQAPYTFHSKMEHTLSCTAAPPEYISSFHCVSTSFFMHLAVLLCIHSAAGGQRFAEQQSSRSGIWNENGKDRRV
nr:hypothetical protein CFP56_72796 [Quercus suber]